MLCQFLCFEDFQCKFGVRSFFLDNAGVLAEIPKLWKSKILDNSSMGGEPFKSVADSDTIPSTKKPRLIQTEHSFSLPIIEVILRKQVFKVTVENKLRSFQFKIIETSQCKHYLFQNKILVHMFLDCSVVKPFGRPL